MRVELQTLSECLTDGETTTQILEQQMTALGRERFFQMDATVALQLQLKDLEDRSCRNNLRLQGIPEATDQENLQDMVKSIF